VLDTNRLHAELEVLTPEQRVAFAAACLEAMVGQFRGTAPGTDALPDDLLPAVIDLSWQHVTTVPDNLTRLEDLYARAESLIDEDEEGELLVGEHLLAGACYSLRCVELRTSEQAVLVANNYYEAADYTMTIEDPKLSDDDLLKTPLVSGVLSAVAAILEAVRPVDGRDPAEVAGFRTTAEGIGHG
jgi:uncharacterized protein YjaG (DUF416 family)